MERIDDANDIIHLCFRSKPPTKPQDFCLLRSWRFDKDQFRLDAIGPELLVIPLGVITKSRYKLEVGLQHSPSPDRSGLFWGYREDVAIKNARTPETPFARFQFLCFMREQDGKGVPRFFVYRGKCELRFNAQGDLRADIVPRERVEAPLPNGEQILIAEVNSDGLRSARFGALDLAALCTAEVNKTYPTDDNRGGLGLVAFRFGCTFSNVRLTIDSKK